MNYYIYYDEFSPEKELSSLPRNYTREIAHRNNDMMYDQIASYNTDRFLRFIDNLNRGIPDRIRITTFGIDRPAVPSILQYNGYVIRLTSDATRYGVRNEYDNFYGYLIVSQIQQRAGITYEVASDVNLITYPLYCNILGTAGPSIPKVVILILSEIPLLRLSMNLRNLSVL